MNLQEATIYKLQEYFYLDDIEEDELSKVPSILKDINNQLNNKCILNIDYLAIRYSRIKWKKIVDILKNLGYNEINYAESSLSSFENWYQKNDNYIQLVCDDQIEDYPTIILFLKNEADYNNWKEEIRA